MFVDKIIFQVKLCIQLFMVTLNSAPHSLQWSAAVSPVGLSISDSTWQNPLELEIWCFTGLQQPQEKFCLKHLSLSRCSE